MRSIFDVNIFSFVVAATAVAVAVNEPKKRKTKKLLDVLNESQKPKNKSHYEALN